MVKPHDYQQESIERIIEQFDTHRKVLYQLSTAGGKTFVFSFLTKEWISTHNQRILVLCHRTELVDQTIESMNRIGVTCEGVTAKVSKLKHNGHCYVSMIETAFNRLKKDPYFFKNVGLIIADECHIMLYDKVFDFFPYSKILGCTATPVLMKRVKFWKCKHCKESYTDEKECCDDVTDEWSKPLTMSNIYETIVTGISIEQLIERGNLVKEISFIKDYADTESLKTDSNGEITKESFDEAYSNEDAVFNVMLNYEQLCKGKKTMIFNGSSKNNLMVYKKFKEAGHNVRMYDSVNKEQSGSRKELIKWFREEDDAVLLNVGVFTTGFDVKEVQAIVLNMATNSLSLYIQIVGRGARSTDKIFKDKFILIDGGGNIDRHQEFSDPTRDWERIFYEGVGKEKCKKENPIDIQSCDECGALYGKTLPECPECGFKIQPEPAKVREVKLSEEVLTPIRSIPPPNGEKIFNYTVSKGENINFAFKIMIGQIVDMFRYYRVTKEKYESSKQRGELEKKVTRMIHKCYFYLLKRKEIEASNHRTIKYLVDKTIEKLDHFYYI